MDFLAQLISQFKQPGQPQLMQVGRNGKPQPSTQGHLPPAQQRDTWLEPAALNASPNGNIDSWNANDPRAMYPPTDPRSRMDTSGYQSRPGGAMVYGATIPNGQHLQEDDFSYPNGGQFNRNPNGSISLNGAVVPRNLGLQEDSFRFQPQQRQVAQDPLADLRKLLGF